MRAPPERAQAAVRAGAGRAGAGLRLQHVHHHVLPQAGPGGFLALAEEAASAGVGDIGVLYRFAGFVGCAVVGARVGEESAEGCGGVFGRGVEELDRVAGADGFDEGGSASGGFFESGGGVVGCGDVVSLGRGDGLGVFVWRF